jgi:hypothetical protein
MCRRQGVVLMLLAELLVGCATEQSDRSSSRLNQMRSTSSVPKSKLVQMEVALIERPISDGYLNGELWDLVDEQVVPLERKEVIADNGFRVGVISGLPPAGLQALLTSERSCPNPRRIQRLASDSATLLLGLPMPQCRFQLLRDGQWQSVEFEQAQCTLLVTPTLAADGRTRLQFTPQVRHGEPLPGPQPSVDRAGIYSWIFQERHPTETYSHLGWEVTLAANEYVVVGGRFDLAQALGHRFFIRGDEPTPVQRLLVVRTARTQPSFEMENETSGLQSPPLAIQAARSGNRE